MRIVSPSNAGPASTLPSGLTIALPPRISTASGVSLGDAPEAVLMRGGSAIVSPLGKVLAGPAFDGETILTADLDLGDIGRGKFDFDVAGHYARPDVFTLTVNEAPMKAVVKREP